MSLTRRRCAHSTQLYDRRTVCMYIDARADPELSMAIPMRVSMCVSVSMRVNMCVLRISCHGDYEVCVCVWAGV
jgi:hypothetical protein